MEYVSESNVYHTTTKEDDSKLYELTVRMKLLATQLRDPNGINYQSNEASDELADTVLKFLEISGWSR